MKKHFDILIADRNPHVRDFLRREMISIGCGVQLAVSGTQALDYASHYSVDLLIVDPDLPDADSFELIEKLRVCAPSIPIVVHGFLHDSPQPFGPDIAAFIEKEAGSIEQLKQVVINILFSLGKSD